ncbi:MAG: RAD55 family ATPase [Candidatus Hecatellaceae archaeon]
MKQVLTGVPGLDGLLGGGLAEGSTTVLIGPIGTLKSYIGQQFIYEGLKGREPCIYISTLQDLKEVEGQVKLNFGWNLKPYVQKNLLKFVDLYTLWAAKSLDITRPLDARQVVEKIFDAEEGVSGGREFFHSLSPLFNFLEDERVVLRLVHAIKAKAKKAGVTVLFLLDEGAQPRQVEENIKSTCDYVLTTDIAGKNRRIRVTKSLTRHELEWHNLILTDKGVKVEVIL